MYLATFDMRAVVAVVFFGGGAVFFLYKIILRKPTLVINSKGIYPTYLWKDIRQLVLWEDIEKIGLLQQIIKSVGKYHSTTKYYHMAIYLKNPEKYNFEKYLSKETADRISSMLGGKYGEGIKADLLVPSTLLPYKIEKILDTLSNYPVKIDKELHTF
jgi:hypothetical protein